jgi:integral membrane sensor domain MASE1
MIADAPIRCYLYAARLSATSVLALAPICHHPRDSMHRQTLARAFVYLSFLLLSALSSAAFAHGVAEGDAAYIQSVEGVQFFPYLYLGAKHMFTGYDHLLFLAGVIFFLYRLRDVALYVSLSVVYKAFDNIGGFERLGIHINNKAAVFVFGLAHGFGLSTKLQDLSLSPDGLIPNMLAFNVGVELGQLAALTLILLAFHYWRRSPGFLHGAFVSNLVIMTCGFMLMGYQLSGYFAS